MTVAVEALALVVGIVFLGGAVKDLAGFGYAVVSTAVLATVLDPATAVVVMILPTLGANVYLLGELDRGDVRDCVERFWPFVGAAIVGTVLGMAVLEAVPTPVLAIGLGALTVTYVALNQTRVVVPGERWLTDRCFRPSSTAKAGLGVASGFVFGASNIAIQVVAYLDSLDLDRRTFVGVLAMILVGISTVRVGLAWLLGLYGAPGVLALSALAAVPGLLGVAAGGYLRRVTADETIGAAALVLLGLIGLRLLQAGAAGL